MQLFQTNKKAWAVIISMVTIGLISPLVYPYKPGDFSFEPLLVPTCKHLLGTDEMGHDILAMLLAGFKVTLGIAVSAALLSTLIGTVFALLSAFYKGWVDKIIIRVTELTIIIPEIVILLFFAAFSKPDIYHTVLAIAFFSWSKVTRIVRAKTMTVIEKEKLQYTLLLKGNLIDVLVKMWREITPAVSTMFVFQCGKAAVYESTLAFFGIGNPLVISWGRLVRTALDCEGIFSEKTYLWYLMPPLICICVFVVSVSIVAFENDRIGSEGV